MLEPLHREIDRLFEAFPPSPWPTPFRDRNFAGRPAPAVDIVEKDKAYEITAELPGLDEKNIEIKYAGGVLTIRGEKEESKEERTKAFYLSERRFGSFNRAFSLPPGIDADRIAATFSKGVLTITLPKANNARASEKKIAVTAK